MVKISWVKEIILNKPFIGTGTGDIKDELKNEFIKIKFQNGIDNNYNCHNQFLQLIATFGFVLGLPILIIYGYSIYRGIKSKNFLFVLLNLFIIFNLLFESMLESKVGIEFFVSLKQSIDKKLYIVNNSRERYHRKIEKYRFLQ